MFSRLERKDEYPENVAIAIAKTESNTIAQVRNPHYRSVSMGHGSILEVVYGSGPPIPTFCAHSIRMFLQKLNLPENNIQCMYERLYYVCPPTAMCRSVVVPATSIAHQYSIHSFTAWILPNTITQWNLILNMLTKFPDGQGNYCS